MKFCLQENVLNQCKKQMYLTWLVFSHLNVLKQLFNCPFHLKVEILFHTLFICLVQRCIKWWDVACFSNVSSSLYIVTVRPLDGMRLHMTSCLHSNCSAEPQHVQLQFYWNTLQEVEWTWKENTAKLFIYWILGRSAIVLNYVSFWMAWQHLPEMKWNWLLGKSMTGDLLLPWGFHY